MGEGLVHINAPQPTSRRKFRKVCPTCKAKRTMVTWFYEWYGPTITCLGCGEQWNEDGMLPRPFEPGWRKKGIARARRRWAESEVDDE